jgi:putative nucleotidyltransferase with HDIG domain
MPPTPAARLQRVPTPRSNLAMPRVVGRPATVSLSDVLSALSFALDLTEGQPAGHTIRSCAIGMRLGDELALGAAERTALYYALLLKDAGCSSNAAKMASLFGSDDHVVKQGMKLVDRHRSLRLAARTATLCGIGRSVADRVRHFLLIARSGQVTRDIMQLRCERGAEIAAGLGFPDQTADAIRALDEHWCGLGHPRGLAGERIPLLARIANVAQTVDVYFTAAGPRAAMDVVRERRGRWFDPALADRVIGWVRDDHFWRGLAAPDLRDTVVALEPGSDPRRVDDDGLDAIARSFAEIVDAKSPFTARHSVNVARYAVELAAAVGLPPGERRRIHRAGLLHDIGKLGVSNRILDKPGKLDATEREAVERHPRHTLEILQRVGAFGDFAHLAAVHHEKLNGTGYPWGLRGQQLDLSARLLAVADIYEALTADRPYRAGMAHAAAIEILARERGSALDGDAVDAMSTMAPRHLDARR